MCIFPPLKNNQMYPLTCMASEGTSGIWATFPKKDSSHKALRDGLMHYSVSVFSFDLLAYVQPYSRGTDCTSNRTRGRFLRPESLL